MALGVKYYYEIDLQQARIQFSSGGVVTNEWVAHDGDTPTISVPTSPGATITRLEWLQALENVDKWIVGIKNAGIILSEIKKPIDFDLEIKQKNDKIDLEYKIENTIGQKRTLRAVSYDTFTDQVTLLPRIHFFDIYWVDYLMYLKVFNGYKSIVQASYYGKI